MSKKLISSEEAKTSNKQHKVACSDCPWRRDSLKGWLGGSTPDEWIATAHSDEVVTCHTIKNQQCAGIAIYRKNVCKSPKPPNLVLPADKEKIFGWITEFKDHHTF